VSAGLERNERVRRRRIRGLKPEEAPSGSVYAVVGCRDCSALWVVADRPGGTECPRCGKRHPYDRLREFVTTDDEDHAREVRASMLAARQGESDRFAELDSFAALEEAVDGAGVDAETYLRESGLDPDAVAAAGERASEGTGGGSSREAVLREALAGGATREEVLEYATEHGLDRSGAADLLDRLHDRGELVEREGVYRPL
jgi:hypothetical protein